MSINNSQTHLDSSGGNRWCKRAGEITFENGGAAAKCVLGGISTGIKKEVETFFGSCISFFFQPQHSPERTRCPYPDRHVLFADSKKNDFLLCISNNLP